MDINLDRKAWLVRLGILTVLSGALWLNIQSNQAIVEGPPEGYHPPAVIENPSGNASETVAIKNVRFNSSPTVENGSIVKFVNQDSVYHTVTIPDHGVDKNISQGESVLLKFNKTGSYTVLCKLHGGRKTKVKVE